MALLLCLTAPIGAVQSNPDLKRIHVGNQAGILKVYGRDRHSVAFLKGSSWSDVSGIDGVKWAPVTPTDRDQILGALGVGEDPEQIDRTLITHYAKLPHLEAVALLGVLATPGNVTRPLSTGAEESTVHFLEHVVSADTVPKVRRQAVLALAIQSTVSPAAVNTVLHFLKSDHNIWDTFTTVQFFDYHRAELMRSNNLPAIRKQVEHSGNPHAEDILRLLTPEQT